MNIYRPDRLPWISLRPVWGLAKLAADLRERQKDGFASTRNWNEHPHLVGLLGEYVYAVMHDLMLDATLRLAGDGGADFGIGDGWVDVKTSTYLLAPCLKHPVNAGRWPARFALVVVDMQGMRGALVGEVDAHWLKDAPVVDFKHGPQRSLSADDIVRLAAVS